MTTERPSSSAQPSPRLKMFGRIAASHFFGLWTTGMAGSIGTSAGFSFGAGLLGVWLGGLVAMPAIVVLGVIVWFFSRWIERHLYVFAVLGPIIVVGVYAMIFGRAFLDSTAIASCISGACYVLLTLWTRRKQAMA